MLSQSTVNLLTLLSLLIQSGIGSHIIEMKSVKCDIDPTVIDAFTCRLKPTRDGRGNITIEGSLITPQKDIWTQFILYYKYRVYQRFLVDLDMDFCKLMKQNDFSAVGLLGEIFYKSLEKEAPGLLHKCPYFGRQGVRGLNADRLMSSLMPEMLPYGLYKFFLRIHRSDNTSIITVEFIGNIKGIADSLWGK